MRVVIVFRYSVQIQSTDGCRSAKQTNVGNILSCVLNASREIRFNVAIRRDQCPRDNERREVNKVFRSLHKANRRLENMDFIVSEILGHCTYICFYLRRR